MKFCCLVTLIKSSSGTIVYKLHSGTISNKEKMDHQHRIEPHKLVYFAAPPISVVSISPSAFDRHHPLIKGLSEVRKFCHFSIHTSQTRQIIFENFQIPAFQNLKSVPESSIPFLKTVNFLCQIYVTLAKVESIRFFKKDYR